MKKQTIAVDLDDVLSASAEGFIAFSNAQWGHALEVEDYLEDWVVLWGVPVEEAVDRAKIFHTSGAVAKYRQFEGALPVLGTLKERYELIVVTSRRTVLKPETDHWLATYYPGIFSAIHYAGIWDDTHAGNAYTRLEQTKAELCRELGADFLIDDQAKHCKAAAEAGLDALLFGNYKWNRSEALPHGVVRVQDWRAVAEYFDAQG